MSHSWRWHIFYIGMWSPAGKGLISWHFCVWCFLAFFHGSIVSRVNWGTWLYRFLVFVLCFNFYIGKTNQIFLSETTMPSTLIFGMQHRLYPFYSIWGTGTIKWTPLRAHTFTIGISWENLIVWHHKAWNIAIYYVASPSIPLLNLFT